MLFTSKARLMLPFSLVLSPTALAIVPVDQSEIAVDGFSGNVGISINGQRGNKDEQEYSLSSILRYGAAPDSLILITDYNYSETNSRKDEDDFYSHLRWVRRDFFHENVDSEAFVQYEYDDIADLSSRKLVGGGARWRFDSTDVNSELNISLGLGAFYEVEKSLSNEEKVSTTRANLYTKLLYSKKDVYPFDSYLTLYYQPSVEDVGNFRAVAISGIEFKISQALALNIETEISHDSDPFTTVEKTDIEYGVRLTYSF